MDCKANCDREVFYEVQLLQKCFVSIVNHQAKSSQQKLTILRFDINLGAVVLGIRLLPLILYEFICL